MHYIYCVQKSNIIHILVYVVVGHGSKHVQLVLLPDMSGRCSGGFFAFTQGLVSLGFGLQWPPITRVTILRGFKRWTASSCSTYISQFHRCPLISFRHWTPTLFPSFGLRPNFLVTEKPPLSSHHPTPSFQPRYWRPWQTHQIFK